MITTAACCLSGPEMNQTTMTRQTASMARSISVLSVTGIICKFVGVLYSIPLARILGDKGLGLFQTVFPTYNLLLTLSSAGLPVAVSRMVAHFLAREEPANARKVFSVAAKILFGIGFLFSFLMIISNGLLVRIVGVEEASKGFYVIAPCVMIVCVLSAFRGYVQGHQNMIPTAISQLIEQVGKVAVSLPLAAAGMKRSMAEGAAGALLGITIVEVLALAYMVLYSYIRGKKSGTAAGKADATAKFLSKRLIAIAVPITISACIIPLAQFIDSALMVNRMVGAGLTTDDATSLYGIFSGMVIRLINIPTALALAISMSLVPAISYAKSLNDKKGITQRADTGIRYASLIGFPCAIGMSVLAKPILAFFYVDVLTPERLQTAAELLTVSALTVFLFTQVQATSSILQGLHHQKIPMYTMIAGVLCKIVLNYVLIGTPGIYIHGGPVASIVCYSAAMIPNLYFCCKYGELKFNWKDWILRPGFAAACMAGAALLLKTVLPEGRLVTILEIVCGAAVYFAVGWIVKAYTAEDLPVKLRRLLRKDPAR